MKASLVRSVSFVHVHNVIVPWSAHSVSIYLLEGQGTKPERNSLLQGVQTFR